MAINMQANNRIPECLTIRTPLYKPMSTKKTTKMPWLALVAAAFAAPLGANAAEWEQIHQLPTTQAHYITADGTHLLSDFLDSRKGGIYISTDNGTTWEKTDVRDYNYQKFYEANGYIFALGYDGRIARSEDGGRSWIVLNYTGTLEGVIEDKALDSCVAYGMTKHRDRIYIADFAGGGVLYTTDNGETWNVTDRESMLINPWGEVVMDNFYNVVDFNDTLFAFGALSVHRFNDDTEKWEPLPINSNFMAVSTIKDGKLFCGRANPNFDSTLEYLLTTEDGETWNRVEAPEVYNELTGLSRNVRCIHSDADYIYTAGPDGMTDNEPGAMPPFVNCPDFFFTADLGASWTRVEGLPQRMYPLTIQSDDDYVYVALYSPIESDSKSGLWRIAKADMATAGVDSPAGAEGLNVSIVADRLSVGASNVTGIAIYDAAGKAVAAVDGKSEVSLAGLGKGVYLYRVTTPEGAVAGKFVR